MNYSLRIFHFIPGSLPSLEPLNLRDGNRHLFLPLSLHACVQHSWGLSWEGHKMQSQFRRQPPLPRNQCPITPKGSTVIRVQPSALPSTDRTSWVKLPVTETLVHNLHRWLLVEVLLIITLFFCFVLPSPRVRMPQSKKQRWEELPQPCLWTRRCSDEANFSNQKGLQSLVTHPSCGRRCKRRIWKWAVTPRLGTNCQSMRSAASPCNRIAIHCFQLDVCRRACMVVQHTL